MPVRAGVPKRLADRQGRDDVCALPYGINTVSLFDHVFLVMLPARAAAQAAGAADPARVAWEAGLLATLASGAIELACAFVATRTRRATPRAALLSTLAGIALGFISFGFLFRTYARPEVGFVTLGVVSLTYFGRVRFRGRLLAAAARAPAAVARPRFGSARRLSVGDRPDGPLQRHRLAAEHRVGRGRGGRIRHALVQATPREHAAFLAVLLLARSITEPGEEHSA